MKITKFSPGFIELCAKGDPTPGEALPCPRCDSPDTEYRDYRALKRIGRMGVLAGVILALVFARHPTVRILAPILSVLFFAFTLTAEPDYICHACHFRWRVQDVKKWAGAIRHDEEAKARLRSRH